MVDDIRIRGSGMSGIKSVTQTKSDCGPAKAATVQWSNFPFSVIEASVHEKYCVWYSTQGQSDDYEYKQLKKLNSAGPLPIYKCTAYVL